MNLILDILDILQNGNMSSTSRIVLIILFALIGLVFLTIVFKLGKYIFTRSNFTLRKMIASRHGGHEGRLKRFGDIRYYKEGWEDTFFGRIYNNNKLALEKGGIYSKVVMRNMILIKWILVPLFACMSFYSNSITELGNDSIADKKRKG